MKQVEIQEQISDINNKLDVVLKYVEQQRLKTQMLEDLVSDVSLVGNDMFKATVEELENKSVELDTDALMMLLVKLIKNVGNLNKIISMMESMNDLAADLSPILRHLSMDVIAEIAELEKKGYFSIFKNLYDNKDKIFKTIQNLTNPDVLSAIEKMTTVISNVKMDDELDNKSFYKLYKEMKKPEVRKSISYSLRIIQELNKELKQ